MKGSIVTMGPYNTFNCRSSNSHICVREAYGWWTTAQQKHDEKHSISQRKPCILQ
jgi:hypothetical protein